MRPCRPAKIVVPYPAGGTIGMDAVAKSDDGHTLAFAAISPLTLNPHVMKVQYDPLKDFVAVASVMYSPVYVLATPKFKGKTFADAIAAAKAQPGKVSIASSGYGSGADLTHVPHKGGSQLITDAGGARLSGGQPDVPLRVLRACGNPAGRREAHEHRDQPGAR